MNKMDLLNQFQNFRRTFQGDPKSEVERLVRSGQISQTQLNELQKKAGEVRKILGV